MSSGRESDMLKFSGEEVVTLSYGMTAADFL
jgi:hypothetical protein